MGECKRASETGVDIGHQPVRQGAGAVTEAKTKLSSLSTTLQAVILA